MSTAPSRQVWPGKLHQTIQDELRSNPLARPCTGWLVDRTSASLRGQLQVQHHDPASRAPGVSDALVFGPDLLATDAGHEAEAHWREWWWRFA